MDNYVSKPVNSHSLIAAIAQCLGRVTGEESAGQQNKMREEQIWEDGFLDTIIDNFLVEVPQVIAELQQAIKRGDVVKLQNISHRLRGATDILGAVTLSARSQALEQAAAATDVTLASVLALELIKDLQKLTAALAE